ncbi:MAG: hypothetical protein IKB28_08270 [Clostridia bacterium]|nr:hypothetical protein [Clostridia bacterium]
MQKQVLYLFGNCFRSFFEQVGTKKEPKKCRWENFASAEATKGAALGARKLLKKFDQNFREFGALNF